MVANIKVKGIPTQLARMKAIEVKIKANVNNAINHAGVELKEEIKESIAGNRGEKRSYDTGKFHDSITAKGSNQFQSVVSTPVPYAIFLEHGTVKMDERRHFANSLNRKKSDVISMVSRGIDGAIF